MAGLTEYDIRLLLPGTFELDLMQHRVRRSGLVIDARSDDDLGAWEMSPKPSSQAICGTLFDCSGCPLMREIQAKAKGDTNGPVRTLEGKITSTLPPSRSDWAVAAYDQQYQLPFRNFFLDMGLAALDDNPGLSLARGIANAPNRIYYVALCQARRFVGVQTTGHRRV